MPKKPSLNLRVSSEGHQGDRRYMEDMTQVIFERDRSVELAFFAVFDGHGGRDAAAFARENLWKNIKKQPGFDSANEERVVSAIRQGFLDTHEAMWRYLPTWPKTASGLPSTAGTTVGCVIIKARKMFVAHVGDSGILMGEATSEAPYIKSVELTQDHKPETPAELIRIQLAGGKVLEKSGVQRVVWRRPEREHRGAVRRSTALAEVPFLAVARSLGDLWSYDFIREEYVVSPVPDISVVNIEPGRHRFLVLASDGLWNVLRPQPTVEFIYSRDIKNRKEGGPSWTGHIAHKLIAAVLKTCRDHSIRADNTTVIVVFLDPPDDIHPHCDAVVDVSPPPVVGNRIAPVPLDSVAKDPSSSKENKSSESREAATPVDGSPVTRAKLRVLRSTPAQNLRKRGGKPVRLAAKRPRVVATTRAPRGGGRHTVASRGVARKRDAPINIAANIGGELVIQ